jgi:hypothetical protein
MNKPGLWTLGLALLFFSTLACSLPFSLEGAPLPFGSGKPTLNCAAFDVSKFGALVGGKFALSKSAEDKCDFNSDNGYSLGIGVGRQKSVEDVKSQFDADTKAGAFEQVTWGTDAGFALGIALAKFGATGLALGRSTSGYAMSIMVTARTGATVPATVKQKISDLLREAARQLNKQI